MNRGYQFYVKKKITILINKKGEANYNIYKSNSKDTTTSSESASLKLEIDSAQKKLAEIK